MRVDDATIARARAVPLEGVALSLMPPGMYLRRVGSELVGPCPRPGCGGRDRFAVHTRKQLWNCRACGRGGDAIGLLMHIRGASFPDAVAELAGEVAPGARESPAERGYAVSASRYQSPEKTHPRPAQRVVIDPDVFKVLAAAAATLPPGTPDPGIRAGRPPAVVQRLWNQAVPIAGTPGEAWLAARGIDLDAVPDGGGLRFHPVCPHGHSFVPCIVAALTDARGNTMRGVRRLPLTPSPKATTLGDVAGTVVRLWPDPDVTDELVIGAGIETTLAAATAPRYRHDPLQPAWACVTAVGLERLPVIAGVKVLTILADHGGDGVGHEAARRCAERWAAAGRRVTVLTPRAPGRNFTELTEL